MARWILPRRRIKKKSEKAAVPEADEDGELDKGKAAAEEELTEEQYESADEEAAASSASAPASGN